MQIPLLGWNIIPTSRLSWKTFPPVPSGEAIADRPRVRDNFTTKVGQGAAPGGQLTFKDESGAKIPKGPKIKEKNLKSDKPEKAQECVRIRRKVKSRQACKHC